MLCSPVFHLFIAAFLQILILDDKLNFIFIFLTINLNLKSANLLDLAIITENVRFILLKFHIFAKF